VSGGVDHRLSRIFASGSFKSLIVPIDDSLISGPVAGLQSAPEKVLAIAEAGPDAVIGFVGQFYRFAPQLSATSWIVNLTASTKRRDHTRKRQVTSVMAALGAGADCVAVHVNFTSRYQSQMLRILSQVTAEAHDVSLPVLAIAYARAETQAGEDENYAALQEQQEAEYADLVAHAVRVVVDLGADAVKTNFTGSAETFERVILAANGRPVVTAGGPLVPESQAVERARLAIKAGAAGISFGRNVFSRDRPTQVLAQLREALREEP